MRWIILSDMVRDINQRDQEKMVISNSTYVASVQEIVYKRTSKYPEETDEEYVEVMDMFRKCFGVSFLELHRLHKPDVPSSSWIHNRLGAIDIERCQQLRFVPPRPAWQGSGRVSQACRE
jgi:hypothetical protein